MKIAVIVLLTMLTGLTGLTGSTNAVRQARVPLQSIQQSNTASSQTNNQIKISIATGGGPLRSAKDIYRVGERVPLVITMTNTGTQPVYVCESDTLYQDRPQLLKDGRPIPYVSFRQSMMKAAETDKTCDKENLPQQVQLLPNDPTVVDWLTLADGVTSVDNEAWYEPLQPGKYTLSNRRRLSCCDGPSIESNTINFVVVP